MHISTSLQNSTNIPQTTNNPFVNNISAPQVTAVVSKHNPYSEAPIFAAGRTGNIPWLLAEIKKDTYAVYQIYTSGRTKNSITLLHIAVQEGHLEIVKILLEKKVDVNNMNCDYTALFIACNKGHLEIVETLIKNYADVNLYKKNHHSPLTIAISKGYEEIANILIANGADVNDMCNYEGKDISVLYLASIKGYTKIVEDLLINGANINALNGIGCSATDGAVYFGKLEIVKLLLEYGADVYKRGFIIPSLLSTAIHKKRTEIVKLFAKNGLCMYSKSDMTFYYKIANKEISNILKRWMPSKPESDMLTACRYGDTETLLAEIKDKPYAVKQKHRCAKTKNLYPLIYIAAKTRNLKIAKILIEHDVNVNACNHNKKTALYQACKNGDVEMVNLLLDNGANLEKINEYIDIAKKNKHEDVAYLLNGYKHTRSPENHCYYNLAYNDITLIKP